MTVTTNLDNVISRINNTYGSWRRDTTIATMRSDWDKLYGNDKISAQLEDTVIEGVHCRWVNAPRISSPAIVLYVHGGGFRLGSTNSHLKLMNDIACKAECKVLGIDYRLMPEHNFPAPLEDTLTIYRWLLEQGYTAGNIIIAGDSAGGGVAAALLQKIKQDQTADLPQPAGMVLLSAWLDMTLSGESYQTREDNDPVHSKKMLEALAGLYSGGAPNLKNPLLSPLFGDLEGLPPTLLQIGDCEVGLSDSISYADKAKQSGSHTEISIWPKMIHVFQMFPDDLPQADQAVAEIALFIRRVTNSLAY